MGHLLYAHLLPLVHISCSNIYLIVFKYAHTNYRQLPNARDDVSDNH